MNKRICFVHIGMQRDGAERVIAKLANYYGEQGYLVDILILLVEGCGYQLHENVRIISLVRDDRSRKKNLWYWIRGIRRHIKETNPDHVIAFSMYVNLITLAACAGMGKDILISERNDPSSDGRSRIDQLLTYLMYPHGDKIVFQTRRAKNCFSKAVQRRSRIIYNPVEVSCQADLGGRDPNKIVTVGRLEKQKNQKLLIYAMRKVILKYPESYLEIYGEGSLRGELEELCRRLKLEEHVRFRGNVSNVHERIADAQVFVLSSDFEGMSNALMEAMMMGLPCISTCCAGSDEIIEDHENGLLVPLRDDEKLSQAVLSILDSRELSDRLGRAARETSAVFAGERVIGEWIDYIGI